MKKLILLVTVLAFVMVNIAGAQTADKKKVDTKDAKQMTVVKSDGPVVVPVIKDGKVVTTSSKGKTYKRGCCAGKTAKSGCGYNKSTSTASHSSGCVGKNPSKCGHGTKVTKTTPTKTNTGT
ncbi:MAG: hypothetical protein IIA45_07595 [Bacteroidetes bacterium]|nr:hypothetical protein [Bacteroidota bacterium]